MPTPNQVLRQINDRIRRLVQSGLADNQLAAFQRKAGRRIEIVFPNAEYISAALKNIDYVDMYRLLVQARAYNLKMCDGALIQMMYDFSDRTLLRHRLALGAALLRRILSHSFIRNYANRRPLAGALWRGTASGQRLHPLLSGSGPA